MSNKEKEALYELFESENNFINELNIWAINLNRSLRYDPSLKNKKVTYMCNLFFNDVLKILEVHSIIYSKMKKIFTKQKSDVKEKELNLLVIGVIDSYSYFINNINAYFEYVQLLPKIDFYFRHEYQNYKEFSAFINRFFERHGIDKLGYQHFIYKPLLKVLRYPLLLEALKKRVKEESLINDLTNLLKDFYKKNKQIEQTYIKSKNDFRLFELSKILRNRIKFKCLPSLFLSSVRRKLFDERDIYVKLGFNQSINKFRVIILDNFVLFCDVVMNNDTEILYIVYFIEQFKFLYHKIEGNEKEYIVQINDINETEKILLFFKDNTNNKIWIKNFQESINATLVNFDRRIKIEEVESLKIKNVKSITLPHDNQKNSHVNIKPLKEIPKSKDVAEDLNITQFADKKEDLSKVHFTEESFNIIEIVSKKEYIKNFFIKTKIIDYIVNVRKLENLEDDINIKLIVNNEGLYLCLEDKYNLLSKIVPQKVTYIKELNILLFILNNNCYVSPLNSKSKILESLLVREKISTYLYTYIYDSPALFLVKTDKSESNMYYFDIKISEDWIYIKLQGKFFIPSNIFSIEHYSNYEIIMSSSKFASLNIENTLTRELTTEDDIFRSCYFNLTKDITGKKSIDIGNGNLLVCFTNFGFLVNNDFQIFEPYFFYTWDESAYDFKVFGKYLIVLGVNCIYIYDLTTTFLVFYNCSKKYQFIFDNNVLKLHDEEKIYKIKFPDFKI